MRKSLAELRKEVIGKPQNYSFQLDREAMNADTRTINLAFASDKPIDHWFGMVKLSMKPGAIRTARLDSGAPLLLDHDTRCQIGVIDKYSFDKDGVARADVRFSRSERAEEVYQDVVEGIRQNVSVGFLIYDLKLESEKEGEEPVYRCDDWEPLEVSIVSIPADISVGVGRSFAMSREAEDMVCEDCGEEMTEGEEHICESSEAPTRELNKPNEEIMGKEIETETTPVEVTRAKSNDLHEAEEIAAFGRLLGAPELAQQAIAEGRSVADFKELVRMKQTATTVIEPKAPATAAREQGVQLARSIPRYGTIRNFKGADAVEKAHRFGQWAFATIYGNSRSVEFCRTNGIQLDRALSETVNEKGGFLVPEEFGNDLIDLREQYGVFRRNAKVVPMASDVRSDPRRTGGLTAYFANEGDAGTVSDKTWDRVQLTAKKLIAVARMSSEVTEDSVISLADDLAGEIAYAFANKEDLCGFIGDGSSTYGGIVGVTPKLKGLNATIANISGLQVGSGNAYSELTLTDFEAVVGLLPQYADTNAAKWFVHRSFYFNVMVKLLLAAGGVTAAEIEGKRTQKFLGYDVEFAQVMPKTEANSQVCAVLGDLALAASIGTRRDTTIAVSEHSRFLNDEIEIRGTERFDINVHSVGNATATAADKVAGPIVGLITAAS